MGFMDDGGILLVGAPYQFWGTVRFIFGSPCAARLLPKAKGQNVPFCLAADFRIFGNRRRARGAGRAENKSDGFKNTRYGRKDFFMEQRQNKMYFWHSVLLGVLCILGSAVLKFPIEKAHSLPVLSVVLATLLGGGYLLLLNRERKISNTMQKKPIKIAAFLLLFTGGAFSIGRCAFEYIDFVDSSRLPNSSPVVLSLVFLLLVAAVGCGHTRTLYMFGLIGGILSTVIFIITLLLSLPNIRPDALSVLKFHKKGSFYNAVLWFSHCYFPAGFLPLFLRFSGGPKTRKRILWGFFGGTAALILSGLCALASLGATAAKIEYPFATAAELISFGKAFSRLEGPVQFLYMISAVTLCAVIYYVVRSAAKAIFKKQHLVGFLLLLPAFLFCSFKKLSGILTGSVISWILFGVAVLTVLALPTIEALSADCSHEAFPADCPEKPH